jgi:hypothetical protein
MGKNILTPELTVNNEVIINMDDNFKVNMTINNGVLIINVYQNEILKTQCLTNQTEFNSIH